MRILISLISDQQIPNLLFIKMIKPDKNIFVTTESMEKKKQSDKIINTLGLRDCQKIIVNQESYDDIYSNLNDKIRITDSDELIINVTGGTKVMSIASYYFGRRKGAKIYYLPINTDSFIKIFPDTEPKFKKIEIFITLKEYLDSYFKEENKEYFDFGKPLKTKELAENLFNLYINNLLDCEVLNIIKEKYRSKDCDMNQEPHIKDFLRKIQFKTEKDTMLSKYESRYLTGGWFEEWVYYKIKEKFDLKDDCISIGVNRKRTDTTIQNDFDIMFIKNNSLYIVECKTSLKGSDNREYSLFSEILYKSAALVRDFGLTPKSYLFTLSPKPKDSHKFEELKNKSKFFRIECVYREDLSSENIDRTFENLFR